LDWSGHFCGNRSTVDYIIETQRYYVGTENVFPVTSGFNEIESEKLVRPVSDHVLENEALNKALAAQPHSGSEKRRIIVVGKCAYSASGI